MVSRYVLHHEQTHIIIQASKTNTPNPVLLFFPETKELTLEELDSVFGVATHKQMAHGLKEPPFWFNRYILRRDVHLEPLVDIKALRGSEDDEEHKRLGSVTV